MRRYETDRLLAAYSKPRPRMILEYLGIADRKGLALANSQRPPGS